MTKPEVTGVNWSLERLLPGFQSVEHLTIYDLRGADPELQLAITTCAGLLNRPQPMIYTITSDDDLTWLSLLFPSNPFYIHSPLKTGAILDELITQYRSRIQGLIIYDPELIDTINVATTLAGIQEAIVVSPQLANTLQATHTLPIMTDLRIYHWKRRVDAYQWAYAHLSGQTSARLIAGMNPGIKNSLRSFLVAARVFVYWLDSRHTFPWPGKSYSQTKDERELMIRILRERQPNTVHLGWYIDEASGVAIASQAAVATLACDFSHNLEVWTALQPSSSLPKTKNNIIDATQMANDPPVTTAIDQLPIELSIPQTPESSSQKIYLSFTISDGDNLQYCQHHMLKLWRNEMRGKLPIGWTIAPALLQAAPAMLQYYQNTATSNDELIAGPSGAAYMFPSCWPEEHIHPFLQRTGEMLQTTGLSTLEVLDSDRLYRAGIPLLSKISLSGMAFTDKRRQQQFAERLEPYGVTGLVSGAGFLLNKKAQWLRSKNIPIYRNFGITRTVEGTIRLIRRAAASTQRPLCLNVYILAWTITPSDLYHITQELGPDYEVVLPGTLLAMLR